MSEYVSAVVKAGREAAKEHKRKVRIGLEFLPPTVSDVVGTDFASLFGMFDWISPKFPEYLTGTIIPRIVRACDEIGGDGPSVVDVGDQAALCPGLWADHLPKNVRADGGADLFQRIRPFIDRQPDEVPDTPSSMGKVDIHPYTWLYNRDICRPEEAGWKSSAVTAWTVISSGAGNGTSAKLP